jgi:phosphate-selective porin OprO/OprP
VAPGKTPQEADPRRAKGIRPTIMTNCSVSHGRRLMISLLLIWGFAPVAVMAGQSLAIGAAEATQTGAAPAATSGGQLAPTLQSADGASQFGVHAALQLDWRGYLDAEHPDLPEGFLVRRARIVVDATVHDWIGFRIAPDFAGGKMALYDAYLETRFSTKVVLRAGKFKVPVGLERLQSGADIRFLERAFPTLVAPNRDVGLGIRGDLSGGRISYAASLTNGTPDGLSSDSETDSGKDLAARLIVQPWRQAQVPRLGELSVGLAGSWGKAYGTPSQPGLPSVDLPAVGTLARFRTGTTADTAVVVDGTRARLAPQATYYRGPFGMLMEYIRSSTELARGDVRTTATLAAWQVAGAWVLTGESASYRGVIPSHSFGPGSGGWGAVEVAVRVSGIHQGGGVFPAFEDPEVSIQSARAFGAALDWYWNPAVKFVVDFERTAFRGGAPGGNMSTAHLLSCRAQLWF